MSEALTAAVLLGICLLGLLVLALVDRGRGRAGAPGVELPAARHPSDGDVRAARWLVGLFVVGLVALWYFGIYDTATGRCNRGDLGACIVAAEQQRTP